MSSRLSSRAILLGVLSAALLAGSPYAVPPSALAVDSPVLWGADGHRMAARAAVRRLPAQVPAFFRDAREDLAWLNPEPDRWRVGALREMDQAWRYDHYINLETLPSGSPAPDAPHRYAFLAQLWEDGVEHPERDVGLLPWRIVELQQRLTSLWARWHEARDPDERRRIQARILDDAGILGHYVTDGSQPHHTTIHFDGWNASRLVAEPNPEGFTEERGFHGRFESAFVSAHVGELSVVRRVSEAARDLGDSEAVREAVWDFIWEGNAQVVPVYRLERRYGFDPGSEPAPEALEFAEARLAAGATMLRDLWWTAYVRGRAGA